MTKPKKIKITRNHLKYGKRKIPLKEGDSLNDIVKRFNDETGLADKTIIKELTKILKIVLTKRKKKRAPSTTKKAVESRPDEPLKLTGSTANFPTRLDASRNQKTGNQPIDMSTALILSSRQHQEPKNTSSTNDTKQLSELTSKIVEQSQQLLKYKQDESKELDETYKKKETELAIVKAEISEKLEENEDLTLKLERLNEDLRRLDKDKADLSEEIDAIKRKNIEKLKELKNKHLDELKKEQELTESAVREARKDKEQAEKEKELARAELTLTREEISKIRKQAEKEMQEIKEKADKELQKYHEELEKIKVKVESSNFKLAKDQMIDAYTAEKGKKEGDAKKKALYKLAEDYDVSIKKTFTKKDGKTGASYRPIHEIVDDILKADPSLIAKYANERVGEIEELIEEAQKEQKDAESAEDAERKARAKNAKEQIEADEAKRKVEKAIKDATDDIMHDKTIIDDDPVILEDISGDIHEGMPSNGKVKGKGMDDGLYDKEIDNSMKKRKIRGWLGVYPVDKISTIPVTTDSCFILNTLPSNTKVSGHWVAVKIGKDALEYYDSFGEDIPKKMAKALYKLLKRLGGTFQLKINSVKKQSVKSANCGWFAMKFLLDRAKGKTFKEATGYKILEDSIKGERAIENWKSKQKDFQFLNI